MNARITLAAVTLLVLTIGIAEPLHAAMGKLEHPALPLGEELTTAEKAKVQAVLDGKEWKYLGGFWMNSSTALRYGGNTIACNKFIEALSLASPKLKVHVKFYRPAPGADECDWMVTHFAGMDQVVVRINLDSKNVDIEQLYLPPVRA